MQGVKVRISGLGGEILNRIGAISQTLGPADIYPALERGTIDAAEWIGPYDDEKFGFVEVAPYYYYPGWWENGLAFHAFINLDEWEALPASYQRVLEVVCQAINTDVLAAYDALNPEALRRLIGQGAKLRSFSTEILQQCFDESQTIYAELSADSTDFKDVFDSMWAFRDDQYKWQQVGELRSDVFNVSTVRK
jgi:TRAP-type mannitol/chloroaromatic compound transport system substrate-binding protein